MSKRRGLGEEKRGLVASRDIALSPSQRIALGAAHTRAARELFMAGLAAGFSPDEALRLWRSATHRSG